MRNFRLTTALPVVLTACMTAAPALAGDIDTVQNLAQSQFKDLSEDLGAALSYKSLAPAEALGVTGFDLSLAVTGTSLNSVEVWRQASGGDSVNSTLPLATLRLAKGLPFNIDIGAFYLAVPNTNIKQYGGEARWAFIEGGPVTPAVAVHATYSKLTGVDQLDLNSSSIDVSISKGFAFITPYIGAGTVHTNVMPQGSAAQVLRSETVNQSKVFGGVNFNMGLPNIALELDRTGDVTSYGAKFGLRW